jgi:hypothetical protein
MQNHPNTIIQSYWFQNVYLKYIPQPSMIVVDQPYVKSDRMPTVFIQNEPEIIIKQSEYLINNWRMYDVIFTNDHNVLVNCPNTRCFVYGTTWFSKEIYNAIDCSKKQFQISHLAGMKIINNASGHMLRQIIHNSQEQLKEFPITFFRSSMQNMIKDFGGNPLLPRDTKMPLFETYQFAFVIENIRQLNQFTEKIMDCLLTKTIPIYYGCPNISEYFNTTGWIILDTLNINIIIEKLRVLTPEYYAHHRDIIEENHTKAKQYVDLYANLNNSITHDEYMKKFENKQ